MEEIDEKRDFIEVMLDMMAKAEGCPMEYKVLKADKDFNKEVHKMLSKKQFRNLDEKYMLSLINFYEQGMSLVEDINKKIDSQEV